jgi:hypothetical protein
MENQRVKRFVQLAVRKCLKSERIKKRFRQMADYLQYCFEELKPRICRGFSDFAD